MKAENKGQNMHPWSIGEFTAQLRSVGNQKYHDKHPFHQLMNSGGLSREQLQVWTANRFYYQKNIPIKDAILLSRCPLREVRRVWVQRILDHDGFGDDPGGIEKWLRLGEGVGLTRNDLEGERMVLSATRFAVDAYVNFVATHPWPEGVASSLTELFAPELMVRRLAAFETHYTWIAPAALAYFRSRPPLARRDSDHGLSLVHTWCRTRAEQERAVAALSFKCDVLWAQLDALYHYCVGTAGRRPVLARHARYRWDSVRDEHQIVFPEGVLVLNESGAAIVRLCDGRSTADIITALEGKFEDGDPAVDVPAFLNRLAEKGILHD